MLRILVRLLGLADRPILSAGIWLPRAAGRSGGGSRLSAAGVATEAPSRSHAKAQPPALREEGREPAVAVIRDDVQMPPPLAASPGLLPVDPGKETDVEEGEGLRRLKDVEGTEEEPATEPAHSFDEAALTSAEVPASECSPSQKQMKDRAGGSKKPSTSKRRSPLKRGVPVDPATD